MKLKAGDKVVITTGKDNGKQGVISEVLRDDNKVVVEGINVHKKAVKSGTNQPSHFVEVPMPLDASNVAYVDPKTGKATRLGYTTGKDGKKVRVTKASGTEIK